MHMRCALCGLLCRFNLALTLGEEAIRLVGKEGEDRTVEDVRAHTLLALDLRCRMLAVPLCCCMNAVVVACFLLAVACCQVQLAVEYLQQATKLFAWLQTAKRPEGACTAVQSLPRP